MLSQSPSKNGQELVSAQYSHDGVSDLNPTPIDPSWILDGEPEAKTKLLHSAPDEHYLVALWECTAGSFRWYFGYDEVVHIIDGEVTVREDSGDERTLRAGDIAMFPKGSTNVWTVSSYVRKVAVNRLHRPGPVDLMKQVVRRGRDELLKLYAQVRPDNAQV